MDDLLDEPAGGDNAPAFSVSELSGAVKRALEQGFSHVRVRGEVGRVSRPSSGHVYLDLKDDRAVLAAVIWRGVAAGLSTQPEQGMEVIATGRLTTFPGQSRYQLVIEAVEPAGLGALMALLERRKAQLAAEGLFDRARKKTIPYLPGVIGVVTSPSGAVIRDILHRLADRFPRPVVLWPVTVQGERCAAEVAAAIRGFNALPQDGPVPRPDVIIVARGGGSVEDLWGFNEEIVVRAAAESAIPLISAVGHETDTTLIDLAADVRAPTPTAAAELAVPVRAELLAWLSGMEDRRRRAAMRLLGERRQRLRDLSRLLPRPEALVADRAQRLDELAQRLPRGLRGAVQGARIGMGRSPAGRFGPGLLGTVLARKGADLARSPAGRFGPHLLRAAMAARRDRLSGLGTRLSPARLDRLRQREAEHLAAAVQRLARAGARALAGHAERLAAASRLLEGVSWRRTLARGYAVIRQPGGAVLPDAASARGEARLEIEFRDGRLSVRPDAPGRTGARDRGQGPEGQGELF